MSGYGDDMICNPTIGTMRAIERKSGMHIAALIVLFNHKRPPDALAELVAAHADVHHTLGMRNFLLEGIGFKDYGSQPLDLDTLRNLPRPDWLDMFKTYVGIMGHSAQEFWQLNLEEYRLALEGFCLLHRIDPYADLDPATTRDLREMMVNYPDKRPDSAQ